MEQVNCACIQLTSGSDVEKNIAETAPLVTEAVSKGAQFVALPENAFYMRAESEAPAPRTRMEEHPGFAAASGWAKEHGIWLLAGSIAVIPEKNDHSSRQYNRSLLFAPDGTLATAYDKIHLFDVDVGDGQTYRESARVLPGSRAALAQMPWGKLGMTVCYDLRFPQLYRALAQAGATMLAVPAAFTKVTGEAHWHVLLRARAIENGCFVIAPAQGGTHPGGRQTYGHSLIIDPWGKILAEGGAGGPEIVMAKLDMAKVAKVRGQLPSLQHDREFS